jgi:hypothetical protein
LIPVGAVKGLKIRRTTIEGVRVYLEKQGYLWYDNAYLKIILVGIIWLE